MNEQGFSPEPPEEESNEPTPEKMGETLKTIFGEVLAEASDEDKKLFKQKLLESPEWIFIPQDRSETQVAPLDQEKTRYDLQKGLEQVVREIGDKLIEDFKSGNQEIDILLASAMGIVESLGGDSSIVIERLTEIGVLE